MRYLVVTETITIQKEIEIPDQWVAGWVNACPEDNDPSDDDALAKAYLSENAGWVTWTDGWEPVASEGLEVRDA